MAENPLLALPHADADRARVEEELKGWILVTGTRKQE